MIKHQNTTSRYIIDSTIYEDRILGTFYSPETKRKIKDVRFTLEHVFCLCVVGSEYEFVVWDLPTHTNKDGSPHDTSCAWHRKRGDTYSPPEIKHIETMKKNIKKGKKYFDDILEVRKLENDRVKKVLNN